MHPRCEATQAAASVGIHLRHADSCLRCQADEARRRRVQRQLEDLRPHGTHDPGVRRRLALVTAGAGGAAVVAAALVGSRSRARRVRMTG